MIACILVLYRVAHGITHESPKQPSTVKISTMRWDHPRTRSDNSIESGDNSNASKTQLGQDVLQHSTAPWSLLYVSLNIGLDLFISNVLFMACIASDIIPAFMQTNMPTKTVEQVRFTYQGQVAISRHWNRNWISFPTVLVSGQ